MSFIRLIAGRHIFACGIFAALLLPGAAVAADEFPFDQQLILDAAPMRPGKRMPMLSVAPNGDATIGLWCKSVSARVELSDATIRIEPGPLPDALPEMMGNGQCTPERIQADQDLLGLLSQVTSWQERDGAIVLAGQTTLKFRPASN